MRTPALLPQQLADDHTLIAQRYAGYFIGHSFRAAQQRVGPGAIQIDERTPWREPAIIADDCPFCAHLSDEDVVRRVAGYQHAIDIEVLRPHSLAYAEWLSCGDGVVDAEEINIGGLIRRRGISASPRNRRLFLERNAANLAVRPLPVIDLPLRLKRKLCIEWNHLYCVWLEQHPDVTYDFETREFYRDVAEAEMAPVERSKEWWFGYLPANPLARGDV